MPADAETTAAPLAGVKVIDIANFLAGPISSMFLADFGADVIKVERPGTGDEVRFWGNNKNGVGLMYKLINRKQPVGHGRPADAAWCRDRQAPGQGCDIIVENYRKGTLERWGLGYDVLSEINPA